MGITQWNGDKIVRQVEQAARKGLDDAGRQIAAKARQDLSKPFPPASRPGEPPHKRTGALGAAQRHEVREDGGDVVLQVGTRPGLKYAPIMASRRPWLAVDTAEALVFDTLTDEARSAL